MSLRGGKKTLKKDILKPKNEFYITDSLEVGKCLTELKTEFESGTIISNKTNIKNLNFKYLPTRDDFLVTIEVTGNEPLLPWIKPIKSNSEEYEIEDDFFLGQGYGYFESFFVSSSFSTSSSLPLLKNELYNLFDKERINYPYKYSFNGYIYPGQVVSLTQDGSLEPNQDGRGIPYYYDRFLPSDVKFSKIYGSYDSLITPYPADGSDTLTAPIVGVALADENHKGPHSIPPKSNNGFHSEGPNLSGTYYSPWSLSNAYGPGEKIPILTKGITSVLIGAMTNIALMAYPLKVNNKWVTVPCIPLFRGEKIMSGSAVYSCAKSHAIIGGAYNTSVSTRDFEDYLTKDINNSLGLIGQTPWDPWVDATWGNWGWTSTPGLSFEFIPDTNVAIGTGDIPGIEQSNRGTVILSGVTTNNVSPSLGNTFLYSNESRDKNNIEIEQIIHNTRANNVDFKNVYDRLRERSDIEGISGRCNLVQSVPERSQRIGTVLETIEGTGKWLYTGQPLGEDYDYSSQFVSGGIRYGTTQPLNIISKVETVTFTSLTNTPPDIGVIASDITVSDSSGYSSGDVITLIDNTLTWSGGRLAAKNAAYEYDGTTWSSKLNGTNYAAPGSYVSPFLFYGFNLSKNNGLFRFNRSGGGNITFSGVNQDSTYYQDFTRYKLGTVLRVNTDITSSATKFDTNYAYFVINEFVDGYPVLSDFKTSNNYIDMTDEYCITEIWNWDSIDSNPLTAMRDIDAGGGFEYVTYSDYGSGHVKGDRINIYSNSGGALNNCVVLYPGMPYGYQEIIATGPSYSESLDPYDLIDSDGTAVASTATVYTDPKVEGTHLPIIVEISPLIDTATTIIAMQYDGGFSMVDPWYHSNCVALKAALTGSFTGTTISRRSFGFYTGDVTKLVTNVDTYNMTRNPLRVSLEIGATGVWTGSQFDLLYVDENFKFDTSLYTFDSVNGTVVTALSNTLTGNPPKFRLVSFNTDTSVLGIEVIDYGGFHNLTAGGHVFQTQREDQINPIVNLSLSAAEIVGPNLRVNVSYCILSSSGSGNVNGDIIHVTNPEYVGTPDATTSILFKFNNNLREIDLPPYAKVPGFNIATDEDAWIKYSNVMSSATNLLDRRVLIELGNTVTDVSESPQLPTASIGGPRAPPTNDPYRFDYTGN